MKREWVWIAGAALVIRAGFVLAYPQPPVVDDAAAYDLQAHQILEDGFGAGPAGEARFLKGPVYPMALAAIYRVAGPDAAAVRLAQALMGAISVGLVYALAAMVFGSPVARIAGMLAAVCPPLIAYTGWLLTETLSVLLLLSYLAVVIRGLQRGGGPVLWGASGVLTGILILHRGEMAAVVAGTFVILYWRRVAWRRIGLALALMALTLLPWVVRNSMAFGRVTLAAPGTGMQLWLSTVDLQGRQEWDQAAPHMADYRAVTAGAGPLEADRKLRSDALRRIASDPASYLRLCLARIPAFWIGGHSSAVMHLDRGLRAYLEEGRYAPAAVKLAMLTFNLGLIVLGMTGIWLAWRRRVGDPASVAVLALPVAVKVATHVVLFAALRYQVVIMPLLIVFAAVAIRQFTGGVLNVHTDARAVQLVG